MAQPVEWNLPLRAIDGAFGCSLDIGGTTCKVAYREKKCRNVHKEADELCSVQCFSFPKKNIEEAVQLVRANADLLAREENNEENVLYTSGISAHGGIRKQLSKAFNVRVENQWETACLVKAFHFLASTCPKNQVVLPTPQKVLESGRIVGLAFRKLASVCNNESLDENIEDVFKSEYDYKENSTLSMADEEDIYPCLLNNMGSGGTYTIIEQDGTFHTPDGTTSGGMSLMGMSFLLIGARSYDELLKLAESGDSSTVNVVPSDLLTADEESDGYDLFPQDYELFSWGKVVLQDKTEKSDYKREDLAKALISFHANQTAHVLYWVARSYGCRRVYLCGGLYAHPLYRELLFHSFLRRAYLKEPVQAYFLNNGIYLVALGALLKNAEDNSGKIRE